MPPRQPLDPNMLNQLAGTSGPPQGGDPYGGDPTQALGMGPAAGQGQMGDPSMMMGGMMGGGPGQAPAANPNGMADPSQQAIWQAFPSTDPTVIQQMLSQGGGPGDLQGLAQALPVIEQMQMQDVQQLQQKQLASLHSFITQLIGPPAQQAMSGAPGPGAGGAGASY
jgi:hypothetical protein